MFQTSSQIESISTRVDGTIKIVVGTQELNPEQMTAVFQLKGKQGWMLFKENHIESSDVPKEVAPEFSGKSPSQRLRSTLFVYWEKNTDKKIPFNQFYESWIEKKLIEIKEYL